MLIHKSSAAMSIHVTEFLYELATLLLLAKEQFQVGFDEQNIRPRVEPLGRPSRFFSTILATGFKKIFLSLQFSNGVDNSMPLKWTVRPDWTNLKVASSDGGPG